MVPGKSFCFLRAELKESAKIYDLLHGKTTLGQNGGCLYLSYCDSVPEVASTWTGDLPEGLIILEDFITPAEEQELAECVHWSADGDGEGDERLKHRQVKHFGYQFLYGSNNVDIDSPLPDGIPAECDKLWPRLQERVPSLGAIQPEQLTMNRYAVGQGIPPHVDTHSAFTDEIISLSLLSDVVMEFKSATQKRCRTVALKRRSLVIMTGASRYDWTHGIAPRRFDIVPVAEEASRLTCREREVRISLTFRRLRRSQNCECAFPLLCDTAAKVKVDQHEKGFDLRAKAADIELENVHAVYDRIGGHFSETRHSPWPQVVGFLDSFASGSVLLDVGCGNGKYLLGQTDRFSIGCDRSITLLKVCEDRQLNTFHCDCLSLPVRDNSIDGCYSIAVIHHLATEERRWQAIAEMARVLVAGGRALIYVWAKDQEADQTKSSYLKQNRKNKKNEDQIAEIEGTDLPLPVHKNRTQFKHQDVLVPWKLKGSTAEDSQTFLRYYHVFEQNELKRLCETVPGVSVLREYYDQGNWCVEFIKSQ